MRQRKQVSSLYCLLAGAFWYLGLFPGILGADNSVIIRNLQSQTSTDWWTSLYFRIVEVLSFGGRQIWLVSLVFLCLYTFSLIYFVLSLPLSYKIKKMTIYIYLLTPFYGVFGVTINHDLTLVSGILILLGSIVRRSYLVNQEVKFVNSAEVLGVILLLTHRIGTLGILVFLLFTFHLVSKLRSLVIATTLISIHLAAGIGIPQAQIPMDRLIPLADIKCVVQDEDSEVSDVQWSQLRKIATVSDWQIRTSCQNVDEVLGVMTSLKLDAISDSEFYKLYVSISIRNIPTVAMAHIFRATPALPPLLFPTPENSIELNPSQPIGFSSGPDLGIRQGVFHPSVDEPSVDITIAALKPFWVIAQGSIFLVNQASWFWGWGGLWILFIFPFSFFFFGGTDRLKNGYFYLLIFSIHITLLLASPVPSPRYIYASIVVGQLMFLSICVAGFISLRNKRGLNNSTPVSG
jgi:hypothetical protein